MKHTFLILCPVDCADPVEVTVERGVIWDEADPDKQFKAHYRLVTFPSSCKCGAPIHVAEPSQEELRIAYHLPEAEDV